MENFLRHFSKTLLYSIILALFGTRTASFLPAMTRSRRITFPYRNYTQEETLFRDMGMG